jgi:predicted enzyme related to lactoylglutathione lyase
MAANVQGEFCWIELAAREKLSAQAFYRDLFGWELNEEQIGTGTARVLPYATLGLGGRVGGALYEMVAEQREHGLGSFWLPYVAVASADEAARKAEDLGAASLVDPIDLLGAGRMAILEDPCGAMLGLWQGRALTGFEAVIAPGAPCWFELDCNAPERALEFYGALFGWTRAAGLEIPERVVFATGRRPLASARALPAGAEAAPAWSTGFAVADCEASCEQITASGGTLAGPALALAGLGRLAHAIDPQGAAFSILQPAVRA